MASLDCAHCPAEQEWVDEAGACVPVRDVDQTSTPPQNCPVAPSFGKPIYPLTGEERAPVDTRLSIGPEALTLTYASGRYAPSAGGVDARVWVDPPSFGRAWLSSLHRQLVVQGNALAAKAARGDGRIVNFTGDGAGNYTSETGSSMHLEADGGGLRLTDARRGTVERYDQAGKLLRLEFGSGGHLSFRYSDAGSPQSRAPAEGYLLEVEDAQGRTLQFSYELPEHPQSTSMAGRVARIADASGASVEVSYDSMGNLRRLTWPDQASRQFLYESAGNSWAMTGIVDENLSRHATITYDNAGRATSTQLAGGVDRYAVTYGVAPEIQTTRVYDKAAGVIWRYQVWQIPSETTVTLPSGGASQLTATAISGYPRISGQTQAAGAGCAASASAVTYDADGNAASQLDFSGAKSCASHDAARGLVLTRVEGLAAAAVCDRYTGSGAPVPEGARKTTTSWHPDWPMPVRVAEPGRITTNVYNGRPDPFDGGTVAHCAPVTAVLADDKPIAVLCKRVAQSTTDTDGHLGFAAALEPGVSARVQQWTYDGHGQVLTATDPLMRATRYEYYTDTNFMGTDPDAVGHTSGDLKSMTSPMGKVTTYDGYDKLGQLLQSTDANRNVTTYTYDARRRLTSVRLDGQQTTYDYDAVGQLLKVTAPDLSWLGFEYDAAHRQIATKDNLGNRIDLELDNAGNVKARRVVDPDGQLARTMRLDHDALDRVQQTVGQ